MFDSVVVTSGCKAWGVGSYTHKTMGGSEEQHTLIERWDGKRWKVQRSPNPGGGASTSLKGVAATSSTNAWAVGSDRKSTLIEHWGGRGWKVQPSPNRGHRPELSAVAATSPINAWAVGSTGFPASSTLIEHWNGKAWKVQRSPNPGLSPRGLSGVATTSSTNAWAVGENSNGPLIERWNGTAWKVQPSPHREGAVLNAVTATSRSNAWAVGSYTSHTGESGLIEHWNGKAWKVIPSAKPDSHVRYGQRAPASRLSGVVAVSTKDAWAVGSYEEMAYGPIRTLVLHWNGKAWGIVRSPDLGGPNNNNSLADVAATSATNLWAVGYYQKPVDGPLRTLAVHWNSTAWKP
jgi:hypothetical protein